ncbi:MAG: tyrosine--tRNA ligase [Acidobacteria bacterium]|nr:tyrosine--tRNA ligase [Acidobacteriota bacterium]MCI0627367.1 tyrosine--tRNA ligase [Acidobacteriota bacterium]MCI0719514.1 tyrosine--tRNA ligase [Acidobacteriota bacterium]
MTIDEQFQCLKKGAVEIIRGDELKSKLEKAARTGKPLRVKAGFDPTAPDLHLGHTVLIRKLKHFQDLGHTVIFLIGDFTGLIGDPSGRNVTRKQLTKDEVLKNAETYKQQVFKILDSEKTVLDFNSRWMSAMNSEDFVRLASRYTVARMLERDEFANRLRNNQPISIHEMLYPLVQGYDSVALEADVELGGTDQKFNLLVGRELQKEYGQEPQIVLTMPILEGLDGVQKMSKSLNNYIGIKEPPKEMFGKVMSIPDELMFRYYELCTDLPVWKIDLMRQDVSNGKKHPKEAKMELAKFIIRDFHSMDEANRAEEEFNRIFQRGLAPDKIEERQLEARPERVRVTKLIAQLGLASSVTEANRLIEQEAVSLNDQKISNVKAELDLAQPGTFVLKVGKRRFLKLVVGVGS